MFKFRLFIIIALILFVLFMQTACTKTQSSDITSPSPARADMIRDTTADALHEPDITGVLIRNAVDGDIYAPAGEPQHQKLCSLFSRIDLSACEESEPPRFEQNYQVKFARGARLHIENNGRSYRLNVAVLDDLFYITLIKTTLKEGETLLDYIDKREPYTLHGAVEAIPDITDISDIALEILRDKSDTKNCAQITFIKDYGTGFYEPGTTYSTMKAYTAQAKDILDNYSSPAGPSEQINMDDCDIKIAIGDTVYYLNTTTGDFIVNGKESFVVNDDQLEVLIIYLHNA